MRDTTPHPPADRPVILCVVRTLTGSEYRLRQGEDGSWWALGRNRPNPTSHALDAHRWWPLLLPVPWPPVVGCPLLLQSRYHDDPTHPDRMPGGGKLTSAVVALEVPSDDEGAVADGEPMAKCDACGGRQGTWGTETVRVRGATDVRWSDLPVRRCTDCGAVTITARAPSEPAARPLEREEAG